MIAIFEIKKWGRKVFARIFRKKISRSLTENGIKIQRFDHLKYVRRITDGALTEFALYFDQSEDELEVSTGL